MQTDFLDEINNHQLRNEIITTVVSNHIANHIGSYFFHDAHGYTGLKGCDIARAYFIVWEIFEIEELWKQVEEAPKYSDSLRLYFDIESFMQLAIFWFLRNLKQPLDIDKAIKVYRDGASFLMNNITKVISGSEKDSFIKKLEEYESLNISHKFAEKLASLDNIYSAMDIVDISNDCNLSLTEVAQVYFRVGQVFHYDWLVSKANDLSSGSYWNRMLVKTIKDEVFDQRKKLTNKILKKPSNAEADSKIGLWIESNKSKVDIYNKFIDTIKCVEDIDSAKLVVSIKQSEILI